MGMGRETMGNHQQYTNDMKVYKIYTNKRDFRRLFKEDPQVHAWEFFVLTRDVATFRKIALDTVYTKDILKICIKRLSGSKRAHLADLPFETIEKLVLGLTFSESLYTQEVELKEGYQKYVAEIATLALLVSVFIEVRYCNDGKTSPPYELGIYQIEELDHLEQYVYELDRKWLRFEERRLH